MRDAIQFYIIYNNYNTFFHDVQNTTVVIYVTAFQNIGIAYSFSRFYLSLDCHILPYFTIIFCVHFIPTFSCFSAHICPYFLCADTPHFSTLPLHTFLLPIYLFVQILCRFRESEGVQGMRAKGVHTKGCRKCAFCVHTKRGEKGCILCAPLFYGITSTFQFDIPRGFSRRSPSANKMVSSILCFTPR